MNVFEYAASMEICFENFLNAVGKERKTTFFSDLSIAEWYGIDSVKDTYKRVVASWKDDVVYMSEFVIALNQKIWQHYETDRKLAKVYNDLWIECDDFCREHFEDDDLSYYFEYID
jgi:hypothetical protein